MKKRLQELLFFCISANTGGGLGWNENGLGREGVDERKRRGEVTKGGSMETKNPEDANLK